MRRYLGLYVTNLLEELKDYPQLFNPHQYDTVKLERKDVITVNVTERVEKLS